MPQVVLNSLGKQYTDLKGNTVQALRDVSLDIVNGELLAVVGPSASGKTTLLRLIAGLELPDTGRIEVNGEDVSKKSARQRNTSMVFQGLALYPHLTAAENIGFGQRLRKRPRAEIVERTNQLAQRLKISNCLDRKPFELSGGQRQRVALARALIRQPTILLLDEPFSHLDGPLRRDLCHELRELHKEFSLSTILVTHNVAEAKVLGQRIAVLDHGQLQQVGSHEALLAKPANPFVAEFLRTDLI